LAGKNVDGYHAGVAGQPRLNKAPGFNVVTAEANPTLQTNFGQLGYLYKPVVYNVVHYRGV